MEDGIETIESKCKWMELLAIDLDLGIERLSEDVEKEWLSRLRFDYGHERERLKAQIESGWRNMGNSLRRKASVRL